MSIQMRIQIEETKANIPCEATFITAAAKKGSKDTREALVQISNINAQDKEGNTALMQIVRHDLCDIKQATIYEDWSLLNAYLLLLENGANPNLCNSNNDNTLIIVASYQAYHFIGLLFALRNDIDIDAKNNNGHTALLAAVFSRIKETVAFRNYSISYNRFMRTLRLLLINGADIEAKDKNGDTALLMAIRAKDEGTIKILLDHEANPSTTDCQGKSAIQLAQELKLSGIVNLLTHKKMTFEIEPYIWRHFKKLPDRRVTKAAKTEPKFHSKFFSTSPAVFKTIISFLPTTTKGNLKFVNKDLNARLKIFALEEASKQIDSLTKLLLLFGGVTINRSNFHTDDVIAFKQMFAANYALLFSRVEHTLPTWRNISPTYEADDLTILIAVLEKMGITEPEPIFLDEHPDYKQAFEAIYIKNKNKLSLFSSALSLFYHVRSEYLTQLVKMISHRSESKEDCHSLQKLLSVLLAKSRPETITLLDQGVNPNTIYQIEEKEATDDRLPVLHKVIEREYIGLIESLLGHGADVNIRDAQGRTALMKIAMKRHEDQIYHVNEEIYYLLINKGAQIDLKDNQDETALSYAILNENSILVPAILREGKRRAIDVGLEWKNSKGQTPLLSTLARQLEQLMSTDNFLDYLLTDESTKLSFEKFYITILLYLEKYNINFNAQDNNGTTALMLAVQLQNKFLVEYLLNQGANPLLTDNKGETALSLAKAANNEEICELLINATPQKCHRQVFKFNSL